MNGIRTYQLLAVFLISALAGTYAYLLWWAPYTLLGNQLALFSLQQIVTTGARLTYGTASQVDAANHILEFDAANPYGTGEAVHFRLKVTSPLYIAYQNMSAAPDGTYIGISDAAPASLSDIHPGDHVALLIKPNADGSLETNYILFGNPF